MKVGKMFPSKFVTGDDLGGKAIVLPMKSITKETVFNKEKQKDDEKWVLYFDGARKGVLLGKTQAVEIADAVGSDETDDWIGKDVELYPTKVKAFGKWFNVVRFRKAASATSQVAPEAMQEEGVEDAEEDPLSMFHDDPGKV